MTWDGLEKLDRPLIRSSILSDLKRGDILREVRKETEGESAKEREVVVGTSGAALPTRQTTISLSEATEANP